MYIKALSGILAAFVGGLVFSVALLDSGPAAQAQSSDSQDLLEAVQQDALEQQEQIVIGSTAGSTEQRGPGTSLQDLLAEEKKAQQDAITLEQVARDVERERAAEKAQLKRAEQPGSIVREEAVRIEHTRKAAPPPAHQTKREILEEGALTKSVAHLESRNTSLAAQLERQTQALEKLKTSRGGLEERVSLAEARVKQLSTQLAEAHNRLMIAETEVERLSHALEQKHGSRLVPIRHNVNAQAAPVRGADDPFFQNEKVSNDMSVATVVTDKANLRAGPGIENSPIMNIAKGTRLAVETRQGKWYRVIAPTGVRAWISGDVIRFGTSEHSKPSRTVSVGAYQTDAEEAAAFRLLQKK